MSSVMEIAMKEMGQLIELAQANLKVLPGPIVNVSGYGAVGDGVTNDTTVVQTAIDYAIANGMKAVFFPRGTNGKYYVTALTNTNQVVLFGDNASFVGGYTGTILQLGEGGVTQADLNALEAETVTQIFNVKTGYGAKGDGVTNDTAAIQSAINATSLTGGVLFFPPGTYLVTATLIIPSNSWGITLAGVGVRSLLILGFSGDLLTFENIATGLTLNHHRIYNLSFGGNGKASGKLIHVKCTSDLVIENCFFFNFTATGDAIYVQGNPTSLESCHDVNIRNNYFDSKGDSGRSGIYLETTAADMQISGNYMELRHTVDYCIYFNNCGTMQIFDNHIYNAKINVLRINGANAKTYMFSNNFLDYSLNDIVFIDGTTTTVANGAISFINCIIMGIQSGYSGFCLVNNVYSVRINDCIFTAPSIGAKSAIRAVTSANVDNIYVENNTFNSPTTYASGVIENLFGFKCVIQNNYGYKKTITGVSWLSLNAWCAFPEQCSGLLYLGLYTTDAVDGAVIIHYREGAAGTDFTIFTGAVSGASTTTSPDLITIPVSPEANILINGATNVAIQSKIFVPFNV